MTDLERLQGWLNRQEQYEDGLRNYPPELSEQETASLVRAVIALGEER